MCNTETIDHEIEQLVKSLSRKATGIFASDDEKDKAIKQIAKLRASMSPQCTCKNKD